jgi:hypothetical protein
VSGQVASLVVVTMKETERKVVVLQKMLVLYLRGEDQ